MTMPNTRPPFSRAPRDAASMTPRYPPVQIVNPASARRVPISTACPYSSEFSLHFEPPKIVTILSDEPPIMRVTNYLIWVVFLTTVYSQTNQIGSLGTKGLPRGNVSCIVNRAIGVDEQENYASDH